MAMGLECVDIERHDLPFDTFPWRSKLKGSRVTIAVMQCLDTLEIGDSFHTRKTLPYAVRRSAGFKMAI